ncbi:DUF2285 domain-containing protein [Mesorhizobium sp. AaZ16]|uniref:DUF2285 domain-containing protein n=1 Tax=Mesorhizobium sp. AaZ16 TaxID=3402289 RepID=UPI00374F6008
MFWDPRDCAHILQAAAQPVGRERGFELLDLSSLSCGKDILLTPAGLQHVLLRQDCRNLQIAVSAASVLRPVRLCVDAIVPLRRLKSHIAALQCLNEIHGSGRLAAASFPPEPRGRRLRNVLQALDGSLAGASHQEIAIALFGRRRVEQDWSHPGGHLRDQVRRAVRRGRYLMGGGYRQFLT